MVADEELLRLPVGDRIRYVRREMLRVNQEAFAKRVGVSVRTVRRWEASFIAPSKDKAEKIAALANLASELFYPDETVEPDPIVEVRQLLIGLEKRSAAAEERFMTAAENMLETLVEIQKQVARQTSLLALIEAKVEGPARSDEPKPRRSRRQKS